MLSILLSGVAGAALAQGRGHGQGGNPGRGNDNDQGNRGRGNDNPGRGNDGNRGGGNDRVIVFTDVHRTTIYNYYGPNYRPRGLPPGLQRQLVRNGQLPPGLQMYDLPPGLDRQLGPVPVGYKRVIIGDQIVLYAIATMLILDVINLIR